MEKAMLSAVADEGTIFQAMGEFECMPGLLPVHTVARFQRLFGFNRASFILVILMFHEIGGGTPYDQYTIETHVNTAAHQRLALEAAHQSVVLLQVRSCVVCCGVD
jgi:hypothetical protein